MEVLQELKVGPTVVQSEETPAPKPKPAIAPLGSKLEFKRVEQVFKDNAFYEFAVEDISDIKWAHSLFKSLTIPDEQRAILMALARTRMGVVPAIPFDDFVAGKGRGLSVLL
ncbi:hypothetical protein McanCB49686_002079 [Microsporum canis]